MKCMRNGRVDEILRTSCELRHFCRGVKTLSRWTPIVLSIGWRYITPSWVCTEALGCWKATFVFLACGAPHIESLVLPGPLVLVVMPAKSVKLSGMLNEPISNLAWRYNSRVTTLGRYLKQQLSGSRETHARHTELCTVQIVPST